jgi:hypothetical protein
MMDSTITSLLHPHVAGAIAEDPSLVMPCWDGERFTRAIPIAELRQFAVRLERQAVPHLRRRERDRQELETRIDAMQRQIAQLEDEGRGEDAALSTELTRLTSRVNTHKKRDKKKKKKKGKKRKGEEEREEEKGKKK